MSRGARGRTPLRMRLLLAACLLAAAAARPARGQDFSCPPLQPSSSTASGLLCMAASAVNAGGACMSSLGDCALQNGLRMTAGFGSMATPMTGGTLKLWPGVVASIRTGAADISSAHAFPTPFMPSQGHTRITFTALPAEVVIRVYTLSGHLVKTLTKNNNLDTLNWSPVANDQGSPLASGIYQFIITQPGFGKKKGKLMIIR